MNEQHRKDLKRKHPEIFPEFDPLFPDNMKMPFYFAIGDGWYALVNALCYKIEVICNDAKVPIPQCVQIKEKFAGLRFYIGMVDGAASEKILDATAEAEERSFKICEGCGKKGRIRVSETGWYKTLCIKCTQKRFGLTDRVYKWRPASLKITTNRNKAGGTLTTYERTEIL